MGVDWPIRYEDIAPWYDYAERFMGISGQAEDLHQLPDGQFLPPMEMTAVEKHMKQQVEAAFPDRCMTIGRCAVPNRGTQWSGGLPLLRHVAKEAVQRNRISLQCPWLLPAAAATGNMTLIPNSIVHSVIHGSTNRSCNRGSGDRCKYGGRWLSTTAN